MSESFLLAVVRENGMAPVSSLKVFTAALLSHHIVPDTAFHCWVLLSNLYRVNVAPRMLHSLARYDVICWWWLSTGKTLRMLPGTNPE